jgi:hypothetical protein
MGLPVKDRQKMAYPGPPGFPANLGVGELHVAFLDESRTRAVSWRRVKEIRVYGRPMPTA